MGHKTVCTHFIKINRFRVTGQLKNSNFGRKSLITSKKNLLEVGTYLKRKIVKFYIRKSLVEEILLGDSDYTQNSLRSGKMSIQVPIHIFRF